MTTHPRDAIVETLHRWPGRGTGAAADLPVPGEPPACDDCGEHHEGYGDCPALPEETPDA